MMPTFHHTNVRRDMLPPDEIRITPAQAAARYPGSHGAAQKHPQTIVRHILTGVLTRDGRRVRLEAERIGSRFYTSIEALQRFSAALEADTSDAPIRTPAARSRSSTAAERELESMGA
jgi:hypothetical protein